MLTSGHNSKSSKDLLVLKLNKRILCTVVNADFLIVSKLLCARSILCVLYKIQISSRVVAQKRCDVELRKELSTLKEDMAGLSMVDEFAKYAKLQRRYNHVESILKANGEPFNLHADHQVKSLVAADQSVSSKIVPIGH